jgi:hypothetical protein
MGQISSKRSIKGGAGTENIGRRFSLSQSFPTLWIRVESFFFPGNGTQNTVVLQLDNWATATDGADALCRFPMSLPRLIPESCESASRQHLKDDRQESDLTLNS